MGGSRHGRGNPALMRIAIIGLVLVGTGGALVGTAVAASGVPSISFTQPAPLGPPPFTQTNPATQTVTVTGSGFHPTAAGAFFECSSATPQPTIDTTLVVGTTTVDFGLLPVSCSPPVEQTTSSTGTFPKNTTVQVGSGLFGPPASGTDNSGNPAINDAANFPCPPTAAQGSAGCVLLYIDSLGERATAPIAFSYQSGGTTTTTKPTTTTTTKPGGTTTTTKPTTTTTTKPGGTTTTTKPGGTTTTTKPTTTTTTKPGGTTTTTKPGGTTTTTKPTTTTTTSASTTTTQATTTSTTSASTTTTSGGPTTTSGNSSTSTTAPPTSPGGGSGSSGDSTATAGSGSLAFTGTGTTMKIVGGTGALFVLLGIAMLLLIDAPRRAYRKITRSGPPGLWR
jgi:hypothetical protein